MIMKERIYTEQELNNKLVPEWKEILSLQSWHITVELCHQSVLGNNGEADIKFSDSALRCHIRIVEPESYQCSYPDPQDMLLSLVHELLHIHLWPFFEDALKRDDKLEMNITEQKVEILSQSLLGLYEKSQSARE